MYRDQTKGIRRLINATLYSVRGIRAVWRHEAAFRQESLLACILIPAAFWLGTTTAQRALLIFSILIVLMVELLNSAIETVVDRIGEDDHPLSEQAKDMGSAAVLFSLAATASVWGIIIWYRLS